MKFTPFLSLTVFILFSCTTPLPMEGSLEPDPNYRPGGEAVFDASASLSTTKEDWYKDEVFYHLWIKSFADSNGDGVGDLKGIISKLDYLSQDLGVTALWLSPHMANNSGLPNLHGYDVTNHYIVDPRFGSNDDMKDLLKQAHARGMRVIFDYVPNHVSDRHPWFQDALASRNNKRGWFRFQGSQPQGWTGWDSWSDWHKASSGGYYYAIFWSGMPDLNFRHPDVVKEMTNVVKFWLDFGFDGLRADAVRYLYEKESSNGAWPDVQDLPETLGFFTHLRKNVLDPYKDNGYAKFMMAENWNEDAEGIKFYLGTVDAPAFHSTLDFLGARYMNSKTSFPGAEALDLWWQNPVGNPSVGWYSTFLSNHDNFSDRPASRFSTAPGLQHIAAGLLLTGPGTPFIYYGNEIAMEGKAGNDINLRGAFLWGRVDAQKSNPQSTLGVHKTLIAARKSLEPLRRGVSAAVPTNSTGLSATLRTQGTRSLLVVHNHTSVAKSLSDLPGEYAGWRTLADTGASATDLAPYSTRILEK